MQPDQGLVGFSVVKTYFFRYQQYAARQHGIGNTPQQTGASWRRNKLQGEIQYHHGGVAQRDLEQI